MKHPCKNGNVVESWYDRHTRSYVVATKDAEGNQIGDAAYSGAPESRDSDVRSAVGDNGGVVLSAEDEALLLRLPEGRYFCAGAFSVSGSKLQKLWKRGALWRKLAPVGESRMWDYCKP